MAMRVQHDIVRELAAGVLDGGFVDTVGDSLPDSGSSVDHPPAIRQAAFQLWAYEAGRSMSVTQRMLEDRAGVRVDVATLRSWRDRGEWEVFVRDLHQILRSDSRAVVQNLLDIGMVKAARWAVSAFDDPSVSDTVKAKLFNSFMDRNGFPIMLRGELTDSLSIPGRSDLADLSDDELEARIYEYANDADQVLPEQVTDPRFDKLQNIERDRSVNPRHRPRD